ncbi:MAG TPA: heme-binding domain-containing protein, partial [Bryobacteraceae bacterium]
MLSLVHPFGTVKGRPSPHPLFAGVQADPAVLRIVGKSCQSCHSDRTEWPWYSYVAPLSWMIESDVHQGR